MEKQSYSMLAPHLFIDRRGRLFEKQAGDYSLVRNKYVEAEERFVSKELKKKGVSNNE